MKRGNNIYEKTKPYKEPREYDWVSILLLVYILVMFSYVIIEKDITKNGAEYKVIHAIDHVDFNSLKDGEIGIDGLNFKITPNAKEPNGKSLSTKHEKFDFILNVKNEDGTAKLTELFENGEKIDLENISKNKIYIRFN